MEITSKVGISLGREISVRHPVRRGGLAWKGALPWGNVEDSWENEGFQLNFAGTHLGKRTVSGKGNGFSNTVNKASKNS